MSEKFDNTFKICTRALKQYRAHPSISIGIKSVIIIMIGYISVGSVLLSQIFSSFHDSFDKTCVNIAVATITLTIFFNHWVLIRHKYTFKELIRNTENDFIHYEVLGPEEKLVTTEYIDRGIKISKIWYALCMATISFFLSRPLVSILFSMYTGNFQPAYAIEATYPEVIEKIKNRIDIFLINLGLQTICVFCAYMAYAGVYPLITIFELHACGQLDIVIKKLEVLFQDEQVDIGITVSKINAIVYRIQEIYRYVKNIQQTQTFSYELCMKSCTICIPVTSIGIIESYVTGNTSFNLIGLVSGFLLQCYIPCYYCDLLQQKGEQLRLAVYECGWERRWDRSTRSTVLTLLMSTSRRLTLRGFFSAVSLESFKDVCRQAYTIFNVMNAARN